MIKTLLIVAGIGAVGAVAYGAYLASQHPIHDLTTDFDDPPQIVAGASASIKRKNPPEYTGAQTVGGSTVRAQQESLYPDIEPLILPAEGGGVFQAALSVLQSMEGFDVIARDADAGTIEATHTSGFFRFVDDFVVRIRVDISAANSTRIDMRSKSRVGRSDLGANAARIRAVQAKLRDAVGGAD
ncbi:MAG: DUF1499 domain-containing protein [Pseudomonadota bacterium]